MTKYRIDLCYLGTDFHGWQCQPDGKAVQDYLNQALTTALRFPVTTKGASRTDSGVHAEHQVAIFEAQPGLDTRRLRMSLSGLLPDSIGIGKVSVCQDDFHPISSATGKLYRYRIWRNRMVHPFVAPHVWQVPESLDLMAMKDAATSFVGEHDFTSFAASDGGARTSIRHLHSVVLDGEGPLINVWFYGNGFLKQMVRNLVGTIVEVGLGRMVPGNMSKIIAGRDRCLAGRTAPPQGLSLVRVFYGEPFQIGDWLRPMPGHFSFDLSLFDPFSNE